MGVQSAKTKHKKGKWIISAISLSQFSFFPPPCIFSWLQHLARSMPICLFANLFRNTPSHPMEGGHKYKLVSKNNTPKGTREVDKWGLFGTKVKEWRGAGRGVFWDGWSEGTKDEKWSDYEDLLGRGLHTHIHVLAAWMSVVFVAPEAGALHSHLCLGTHPHAHTQSWLMHKHNLLFLTF